MKWRKRQSSIDNYEKYYCRTYPLSKYLQNKRQILSFCKSIEENPVRSDILCPILIITESIPHMKKYIHEFIFAYAAKTQIRAVSKIIFKLIAGTQAYIYKIFPCKHRFLYPIKLPLPKFPSGSIRNIKIGAIFCHSAPRYLDAFSAHALHNLLITQRGALIFAVYYIQ